MTDRRNRCASVVFLIRRFQLSGSRVSACHRLEFVVHNDMLPQAINTYTHASVSLWGRHDPVLG